MLGSKKTCSSCKIEKEVSCFSPTKRKSDGTVLYRNSWCTECRTNKVRVRPKFKQDATTKECRECREAKPWHEFYPSTRGKCGLAAYCKDCSRSRFKPSRERSRKATSDYRKRHKERYKALHRLAQYKRRTGIAAASDGTVTDEILKNIYNRANCFWCERYVPREDRTLEHIQELSQGGAHSVTNITMACRSCNSARLGRKK